MVSKCVPSAMSASPISSSSRYEINKNEVSRINTRPIRDIAGVWSLYCQVKSHAIALRRIICHEF